jgi:hypothetical protein
VTEEAPSVFGAWGMADVVLLAATVVFFALAFAFAAWMDRI